MTETFRIEVAPDEPVTAIAYPAAPRQRVGACLVLAHGAGANQSSGFMVSYAGALAARGIDAVTFNFLYTENKRRLPDPPARLEACYRAIVRAFHDGVFGKTLGGKGSGRGKLVIGGKSMGGRIASQIAAAGAEGIDGLVFLGYPLHPPGQPEKRRDKHLPAIAAPMLFVQGARDAFGTPGELRPILQRLRAAAELCVITDGDHSFKVPKSSGRSPEQVQEFVLDAIARWLHATVLA